MPGSHPERHERPLVYAHRGGAALRPENTIVAFDHGLAAGADGLELDVLLSRDGMVVVHHDLTVERTTDARGPVADYTADELGRLDAGYWFTPGAPASDPSYPFRGKGIGVPLLSTVLRRYRQAPLIIELKGDDPELGRRTVDEVRSADAVGRVAVGSFFQDALRAVRRYEPRICTGAAREEIRWALYRSYVGWPLGRPQYRELQVPERSESTTIVSPRFIAHAHRAGLPVNVWTVNERTDMIRLLDWGVNGLITDRPDLAIEVVREWGRSPER